MIPCSGSRRLIRSDPTRRETGRPCTKTVTRARAEGGRGIHSLDLKSFHDNTLGRRFTGWRRRAWIVHSVQVNARGKREARPSTTEET